MLQHISSSCPTTLMCNLLVIGPHDPYRDYVPKRKGVPLNCTILMTFMKKKKNHQCHWKCRISCLFPIDFSFLWECDQHSYSCSLSACMLQCCFLFGMVTSVGLCEDCIYPSLSSSPLPFSICELYGRTTIEYFQKQNYDGLF